MKRIFAIALVGTLMACNQVNKHSDEHADTTHQDLVATNAVAVSFKDEKTQTLFAQYEDLKNALVKSDSVQAKQFASSLKQSLDIYPEAGKIALSADSIANTTQLIAQRKSFTNVSQSLITLFKTKELSQGVVYIQHCPMANKGDGGDWLSSAKEIRNPYYGDEMLECGRVVEEIKSK
ncbi:DUF3347 domain-containing protein [Pedobacter sp. MW01-1-1]|uniref:DUF3347 domain-containing protein n=1 Tax=Pedobacter sp. MW01-1-1 TaxID=3383027 RepID=UPI003FEE1EBB